MFSETRMREEEYRCWWWKLWGRRAMYIMQWDYVEGGPGILSPFYPGVLKHIARCRGSKTTEKELSS